MLDEPWAERLIARQTRANDRVAGMIERYQIQCEWQQNGYVMGASYPRMMKTIGERVRTYNAVGAKTRALDKEEVERIDGSPRFYGGWLHEEGGASQSAGLFPGLARAVIQEGGIVYTNSPINGCEREGTGWTVSTPRGKVMADKVIFATGAYTVGGCSKVDQPFKFQKVFVAAQDFRRASPVRESSRASSRKALTPAERFRRPG